MFKSLLHLTFLAFLIMSFSAVAGTPARWSNYYLGMNAGYVGGFPNIEQSVLPDPYLSFVPAPLTLSPYLSGESLGLQLGHDWQLQSQLVVGLEYNMAFGIDLNGSSSRSTIQVNNGTVFPGIPSATERLDWLANLRPRIGFLPKANWLIYGTGGFAFAQFKGSSNIDIRQTDNKQYPSSFSSVLPGWVLGAGLEWQYSEHWSLATEYLYNQFQSKTCIANTVPYDPTFQAKYVFKNSFQWIQLAISYRF